MPPQPTVTNPNLVTSTLTPEQVFQLTGKPINTTIDSSLLNTNSQFALPPQPTAQAPQNVGAQQQQQFQQHPQQQPQAPVQQQVFPQTVSGFEQQRSALLQKLQQDNQKLTSPEITQLQQRIAGREGAFNEAIAGTASNTFGVESQGARINALGRQKAAELNTLTGLLQAKYEPIRQEIENTKMFLELNYQDLSRADKLKADSLDRSLQREKLNLDKLQYKQNLTTSYLAEHGAPSDLVMKAINANSIDELKGITNEGFDSFATSVGLDPKILSTPDYKVVQALGPAVQAIEDYKAAVNKWGSGEKLNAEGAGEMKSAYGDAISAWKTLAGLGALSGADFGLAENVIPAPRILTRDAKVLSQLDGTLGRAQSQVGRIGNNLKLAYPGSIGGIDAVINGAINPSSAKNDPLGLGIGTPEGGDPLGLGI